MESTVNMSKKKRKFPSFTKKWKIFAEKKRSEALIISMFFLTFFNIFVLNFLIHERKKKIR